MKTFNTPARRSTLTAYFHDRITAPGVDPELDVNWDGTINGCKVNIFWDGVDHVYTAEIRVRIAPRRFTTLIAADNTIFGLLQTMDDVYMSWQARPTIMGVGGRGGQAA